MVFLNKIVITLLIALPLLSILHDGAFYARGEDAVEEDEVIVEEGQTTVVDDAGEIDLTKQHGSPDADTTLLFTKPIGDGAELYAGKLVELLVGFTNKGTQDFTIDTIDASFRYPMDFSFFIQNFTVVPINKLVKPKQEATVMYSFLPSEAFAGRPLGLSIFLAYHNDDGVTFDEAIFNQTVNILEVNEGMDGETFFLYLFLLAFAVLLLLAGHHFLTSFGRKKGDVRKRAVETGTANKKGIDYDFIPKEHIKIQNNQLSPRKRKAKNYD